MLLSKEFLIQSIQRLVPTTEALSVLSAYIICFQQHLPAILEIIAREHEQSNIYHRLYIIYLLNELLIRIEEGEHKQRLAKEGVRIYKSSISAVLQSIEETKDLQKSKVALLKRYLQIKKVWAQRKFASAQELEVDEAKVKELVAEDDDKMDYEYVIHLAKKKDKSALVKYVNELQ